MGVLKVLEVGGAGAGGTGTGTRDYKGNFEFLFLWKRCNTWEIKFIPAQSPPLCLKT